MSTPVKVESTITLTFGETKIELSMADARKLMGELQEILGPKICIGELPTPRPERPERIPYPWDKYPPPFIPQREPHRWRPGEVICDRDSRRAEFATLSQTP